MHASILLQTELQCLPTQLVLVDCTSVRGLQSLLPSSVESCVDIFEVGPLVKQFDKNDPKPAYKAARPLILQHFSALYDNAYVVSVISSSHTLGSQTKAPEGDWCCGLSGTPRTPAQRSCSKNCHWTFRTTVIGSTSSFPVGLFSSLLGWCSILGIIRLALGANCTSFLSQLAVQYFGVKTPFATSVDEKALAESKLEVDSLQSAFW
jgi:hypothetical protein